MPPCDEVLNALEKHRHFRGRFVLRFGEAGSVEQLSQVDPQCACDGDERCHSRIGAAGLDVLPVLYVQPRAFGGFFLRQLGRRTVGTYRSSEPCDCCRNTGGISCLRSRCTSDLVLGAVTRKPRHPANVAAKLT